jgi:hypothetical protein
MSYELVFQLVIFFIVVGAICSLIVAGLIKFFERSLTFRQAFFISVVTTFVILVLHAAYKVVQLSLGTTTEIAGPLGTVAALFLTAVMITRLAFNYGIKREGRRFSLGTKVVFAIVVLTGVYSAAVFGLLYYFRH